MQSARDRPKQRPGCAAAPGVRQLARKFLYVIATLIVLAIAAAFAYRLWGAEIIRWWAVPSAQFQPLP